MDGLYPPLASAPTVGRRSWVGRGIAWLISGLALIGCAPNIEITQDLTPPPLATAVPQAHALAIVGVDFDPPLEYAQVVANGRVTLLVAIENRGQSDEHDLTLSARLLDGGGGMGRLELLNERLMLERIGAGEVQVVRFSPVTQLPRRQNYQLQVTLSPAVGEIDLSDNQRTYEITVQTSE